LWQIDQAGAGVNPDNLGGATQLGAAVTGGATGLATDGVDRLFVSRVGGPYWVWTVGGGSFDTTPTLVFNGVAYFDGALWGLGSPAEPSRLLRATSPTAVDPAGWTLDSPPRAAAVASDGLYVGTAGALWRVRASNGTYEVAPVVAGAAGPDDFGALVDYGGEVYTWYGGQVMRHRVTAAGAAALVPTGLRGTSCGGLAVASGRLIATVTDAPGTPGAALWAYDGAGWWCLAHDGDGLHDYIAPLSGAGYCADADLLCWAFGQTTLFGYQFQPRPTQPGLAPGGELTTALWCGSDPDQEKAWVRVGAELAWPGGDWAANPTVTLAYSRDGVTWTTAGSQAIAAPGVTTLAFTLPSGTTGRWLQLRYTLAGVLDSMPALAALWAEYRPLEPVVRRRHWQFDLLAADATSNRAGVPDPRAGGAIAADLWAAWEANATLTFRDLDYDRVPTERAVRLVALDEQIAAPADAGRWGESVLRVRLVEV
ncbi:MAG: discoidin domain-containing protein, partial [Thermomicrobiales bacterium]